MCVHFSFFSQIINTNWFFAHSELPHFSTDSYQLLWIFVHSLFACHLLARRDYGCSQFIEMTSRCRHDGFVCLGDTSEIVFMPLHLKFTRNCILVHFPCQHPEAYMIARCRPATAAVGSVDVVCKLERFFKIECAYVVADLTLASCMLSKCVIIVTGFCPQTWHPQNRMFAISVIPVLYT